MRATHPCSRSHAGIGEHARTNQSVWQRQTHAHTHICNHKIMCAPREELTLLIKPSDSHAHTTTNWKSACSLWQSENFLILSCKNRSRAFRRACFASSCMCVWTAAAAARGRTSVVKDVLSWYAFTMHSCFAASLGHNAECAHKCRKSLHLPDFHSSLLLSVYLSTHLPTHMGACTRTDTHSFTQTGERTINSMPMMWCRVVYPYGFVYVWLSKWREREAVKGGGGGRWKKRSLRERSVVYSQW